MISNPISNVPTLVLSTRNYNKENSHAKQFVFIKLELISDWSMGASLRLAVVFISLLRQRFYRYDYQSRLCSIVISSIFGNNQITIRGFG